MPVLVDGGLRFDDGTAPRATVAVNRWLRELPGSGAPSPSTWAAYARILRDWMVFLAGHGIGVLDTRGRLRAGVRAYAVPRAAGAPAARVPPAPRERPGGALLGVLPVPVARGAADAGTFA